VVFQFSIGLLCHSLVPVSYYHNMTDGWMVTTHWTSYGYLSQTWRTLYMYVTVPNMSLFGLQYELPREHFIAPTRVVFCWSRIQICMDDSFVAFIIMVYTYCDEIHLTIMCSTLSHRNWATTKRSSFNNITSSICSVSLPQNLAAEKKIVLQEATNEVLSDGDNFIMLW
jgi:hypothetical protein